MPVERKRPSPYTARGRGPMDRQDGLRAVTYYEELGISPRATPEAIQQAYRHVARLLHPDQQADEHLRQLAENQMKRLNHVRAVLSDPRQRLEYDRDVLGPRREKPAAGRRFVWGLLAATAVAALAWLGTMPRPARVLEIPSTAPPARPAPAAHKREVAGRQVPMHKRRRAAAYSPQAEGRVKRAFQDGDGMDQMPEAPPEIRASLPAWSGSEATRLPPPRRHGLEGTWFYGPQSLSHAPAGVYPPEFIEVVIRADNDILKGRYRARYRIADRAISGEVRLQFEGAVAADGGRVPWTGPGGARGEILLRLLAENSLQLEWVASELGAQMDLAAGRAILTRRQER